MATSPDRLGETGSFPIFDWIRFALASIVALAHEGLISWGNAGNFAVQVFFALSGWLIGGILLRTEPNDLPSFFYNRATRIWIPYSLAVGAIYLLSAIRSPVTLDYFKFLFYDVTFTHNWFIPKTPLVINQMPLQGTGAHFWSIAVEEQFYLASPLIIVFLPIGRSPLFWGIIAATAIGLQSWYGAISIGVLAAVVRFHWGDWHYTSAGMVSAISAGAIAIVIMISFPTSYGWCAPVLAGAIVMCTSWQGVRGKMGQFFGGMSYPLYLYHWVGVFVMNFVARRFPMPVIMLGVAAYAVAFMVGSVAYLVVDRNILKWRRRLFRPPLAQAVIVTAYSLMIAGVLGGAVFGLGV